jgi:uncharacterized protein (TIGR03435 family)
MIGFIINHLWQSSCFALFAALLAFLLRRNSPKVRYWIWLSASLKFLAPLALLVSLGSLIPRPAPPSEAAVVPVIPNALLQIAEPLSPGSPSPIHAPIPWMPAALGALWGLGFLAVTLARSRSWFRVRAILQTGKRVELPISIPALITPGVEEPGVAGLLRPVLILPARLLDDLDPLRLKAVLEHEMCHVRRRDNLFAAVHMVVEAIFWFHPLVWWMGSRMVEERELACDEEVLRMGCEPADYVEGILKVCRFCSESPLPCVSGVTGADVRKRLEAILERRVARELRRWEKAALLVAAAAVFAAPIAVGVLNAPALKAQAVPAPHFEVASIKRCADPDRTALLPRGGRRGGGRAPDAGDSGMLRIMCRPLQTVIAQAYVGASANPGVHGGPAWIDDRYTIIARPESPQSHATMAGPMMQTLLEERFKLQIHRGGNEVSGYDLVIGKDGPKLPSAKDCTANPPQPGQTPPCNYESFTSAGMDASGWEMAKLAVVLGGYLNRPVIDKTGIAGAFDFHLDLPPLPPPGSGGMDDPNTPDVLDSVTKAAQKLGFKLEPVKVPVEYVVIDHIERPTEN